MDERCTKPIHLRIFHCQIPHMALDFRHKRVWLICFNRIVLQRLNTLLVFYCHIWKFSQHNIISELTHINWRLYQTPVSNIKYEKNMYSCRQAAGSKTNILVHIFISFICYLQYYFVHSCYCLQIHSKCSITGWQQRAMLFLFLLIKPTENG